MSIAFDPRDIQVKALGRTAFTISEPKSGGVAIEGHEQLQQRLSVTRMATLGVFSLAAPKKMRRATSYITLSLAGGETGIRVALSRLPARRLVAKPRARDAVA